MKKFYAIEHIPILKMRNSDAKGGVPPTSSLFSSPKKQTMATSKNTKARGVFTSPPATFCLHANSQGRLPKANDVPSPQAKKALVPKMPAKKEQVLLTSLALGGNGDHRKIIQNGRNSLQHAMFAAVEKADTTEECVCILEDYFCTFRCILDTCNEHSTRFIFTPPNQYVGHKAKESPLKHHCGCMEQLPT